MSWFKAGDLLDKTFETSIILKALEGGLEVVGGVLLIAAPAAINNLAQYLTQYEISEDPNDYIATHILSFAHNFTGHTEQLIAAYFLVHGLIKIFLVLALLKNKIWAYPAMIAFIVFFILLQLYRQTFAPSLALAGLTMFDSCVAWLTYREYLKQRHNA